MVLFRKQTFEIVSKINDMKILYIAPENTVGTLDLWKKAHEAKGNHCDFVTLYETKQDYNAGICLKLPLIRANSWYLACRHYYYKLFPGKGGDYKEKEGNPPIWKPNSYIEKLYFKFRDWIWGFTVESAIKKWDFLNYDVFHLEWGLEFYRDGRFVKKLNTLGKPIICTYHGQDLRTRGIIPQIDKLSWLNLSSELDLLEKYPDINYLFLPYDTNQHQPSITVKRPIRICHSPTNRYYKGSETIIPICEELANRDDVEFILIENLSHKKAQKMKQSCDILIDQVHNRGGWGYGMNSVEAMSMGLCCLTELIPEYVDFIPDHPFVNVTGSNLHEKLLSLIDKPNLILSHKQRSRKWVIKHHNLHQTANELYKYYSEQGII